MAPLNQLNYATLGRKSFQVYSYMIYSDDIQIEEILRGVCKKWNQDHLLRWSDFWLLNEPIHFGQVSSNPWLLDSSIDLADHATQIFNAEKLFDIWTNRDTRHLHAVLRIGGAD